MTQPRKKPGKPQNIRTWIRQRTSPYDFGVKAKAGKPAHCNKNDDIKYHFACFKMGWHGRRLSSLKNADMSDHFGGRKTFYFTSDGRSKTHEVLINIDIDCHGAGTLAGAIAFAEHLKATRFPNLYYEVSTNGNGVHGYIIVEKGDLGDEGLNGALIVLDRWLKAELARGSWNVENVEVKGQAPVFTWAQAKWELLTYKAGQIAKLPREALARADELRGTTRITVSELRILPLPATDESVDSVVSGRRAAKKTSAVSVPVDGDRDGETSVVSAKTVRTKSGSIAGRHFDEDELAKLGGGYLCLAKELLDGKKLLATGRKVVTGEDLAVLLMIMRFFSSNMNADGSLPVARWKEMWSALHGAGDVQRAWCHHRFATMRNYLSDKSLIAWQDESFVVGGLDDLGRFVPGRAAKWKAGEELMARLEAVQVGGVDASEVVGVESVEVKEEGGSILYGNKQTHLVFDQPVIDQDDHDEAPKTGTPTQTTPDPRQATSFQKFLDDFGIWTPLPRPRFAGYSTGHYRMAA